MIIESREFRIYKNKKIGGFMIIKEQYEKMQSRLDEFRYNSMRYIEFEEIKTYDILYDDKNIILIYGYNHENNSNQYHWACNEVEVLIGAMDSKESNVLITFVPKEWVNSLKEAGFQMYATWNDYFLDDLQVFDKEFKLEKIKTHEYDIVSKITLACLGQSRGFSGQTMEWVRQWAEGREPALPSYAANSSILVKKINDVIVGIICVATYSHESERGAILWIREIAVHPDHQRKGIARELIKQAYQYGKMLGAKRAFLMADECNEHAIHLYESMGFRGCPDESEINMIK